MPQDILNFWIDAGPEKWWRKDAKFDAEINSRFGALYEQACAGKLDNWASEPESALALIILLDQFSRNLHRNSPRAFAQDAKCAALVHQLIDAGMDRQMPEKIAEFCYMPLMHSEQLQDQETCLHEMKRTGKQGNIKAAKEHLEIIEKFGRFPHRNPVLGRDTTPEEKAFLDGGGFSG